MNAVNSTSLLLRETSLTVSTQLGEIDKSIVYINKLSNQLKDINDLGGMYGTNSRL